MSDPIEPPVAAAAFRSVMAQVCTPVAVVTAFDSDRPHGTTVSAFTSLSLDPPMMLVSLDRGSQVLALVRETGRFGINILAHDQAGVALQFSRKGDDKFTGVEWAPSSSLPRLGGVTGWVACSVASLVDGGDHIVVHGLVTESAHAGRNPLTYHAQVFGTHRALESAP